MECWDCEGLSPADSQRAPEDEESEEGDEEGGGSDVPPSSLGLLQPCHGCCWESSAPLDWASLSLEVTEAD